MRIPAATNYAVRALVELAAAPETTLPLHVIAERQQISHRFLEHIFRDLRAAGLVASHRGGHGAGGYRLVVPADDLTLAAVVAATRPRTSASAGPAAAGQPGTSGHPGLDAVWLALQERISLFLDDVTIAALASWGDGEGSGPDDGDVSTVARRADGPHPVPAPTSTGSAAEPG